jgi:large subunit ribosomal protein L21e
MPSSNGPLEGTRNKLKNTPRERGTSPPQRAVEQYDNDEKVHIAIDPSVPDGRVHPRFHGLTGKVVGQQGQALKVRVTDGGKEKDLIVKPAHLTRQE